ncbi:MAG: leucine-rich repeat protein [Muribaculum sp.]|nr:leucine-rich repeat protein [Muribaculum sp.]
MKLSRLKYGRRMIAYILSVALVMGSGDAAVLANAADGASGSPAQADGSDIAGGQDGQETAGTADGEDYCTVSDGNLELKIEDIKEAAKEGKPVTITIPTKATSIPAGVLGMDALDDITTGIEIVIPEGSLLETIAPEAFANSAVTSLTISADVPLQSIGDRAFAGSKLTEIIFEADSASADAKAARIMALADEGSDGDGESGSGSPIDWGEYVFEDCDGLQTVILPENTTEITDGMFNGCLNLETIDIPESCTKVGVSAFEGCENLQTIDFPKNVTEIGDRALVDCKALQEVIIRQRGSGNETDEAGVLQEGVSSITLKENLFGWTQTVPDATTPDGTVSGNLTDPTETIILRGYNGTVKTYAQGKTYLQFETLFEENDYFIVDQAGRLQLRTDVELSGTISDAKLPNNAEKIPKGIFNESDESEYSFTALAIDVNQSRLGEIAEGAFENSAITSLELPEGVKELPLNAFKGSELQTITTRNLTAIRDSAFENCSALTGVLELPNIETIGQNAFADCAAEDGAKLEFVFGASLESIGQGAFQESGVSAVEFGDGTPKLEEISDQMFAGCTKLSAITIPESCTRIGNSAFMGCESLSEIAVPQNCSLIGDSAFQDCTSLAQVTIPEQPEQSEQSKVTVTIGDSAFAGCEKLKEIELPASVTAIGKRAFFGCGLTKVLIYQCADSEDGVSTIVLDTEESEDVFDQPTLTLYGYDGTVEQYVKDKNKLTIPDDPADKKYQYTFHTLFEENDYFRVDSKGVLHVKNETTFAEVTGTVELPHSAKRIPAGIFSNHAGITGLTVPEDSILNTIDEAAFTRSGIKSLVIPQNVKEIQDDTFRNAKIETVTFREGSLLERIGKDAFSGSSLKKLELPYTLVHSEGGQEEQDPDQNTGQDTVADQNPTQDHDMNQDSDQDTDHNSESTKKEKPIPIEIGDGAFDRCSSLETISLRAVKSIGASAFEGCDKLSTIQWGSSLVSVGSEAFLGCPITSLNLTELDKSEKSVTWGSGVFEKCTALRTVTLPENMTTIPANMFKDCTALTTLTLPEKCACKTISQQAFSGCSALVTVNIPAKVSTIGSKAFANCKSLIMVTIHQQGEQGESTISIAEDAFPVMKLTMRGYDGTVETYAALKGYTFRTLFTTNTVTVDVKNKSYGEASVSKETARGGEVIEVTVTPKTGYRLKASSFTYNGTPITNLKTSTNKSQTFTFLMPNEEVLVIVEFEKDESYGKLTADFEQVRNMPYLWDAENKTLTFAEAGLAAKLVVEGEKSNGEKSKPGSWELTYSSTSSKLVRVDSDGVVYALGKGSAKIMATLKSDSSQKVTFTVNVLEDLEIGGIELKVYGYGNKAHSKTYTPETGEEEEEEGTTDAEDAYSYPVLEYTKSTLQQGEQSFTVEFTVENKKTSGAAASGMDYFAKSEWKSSNTGMLTVDQATVYNNKNVVRVKKGVTGEASVSVTVGKQKRTVIVRVIDSTPKLVQTTLTLNSRSTEPKAAFELLPVYEYDVVPGSLRVVQAVKKDGMTNYEQWEYAEVSDTHSEEDKYYLKLTEAGKTQIAAKNNQTFKDIFLQGSCKREDDDEAQIFYVPIKSVVLTNKALKPSVKFSGKINLFYNGKASTDERGFVTFTQSLKDLTVAQYRLLSEENYKAGRYKDPNDEPQDDAFANNFEVKDNAQIVRTGNDLAKVKNKAVTSGYLGILYDGYDEFCWVKITVPTKTTKPAYVLSKTKATVSAGSTSYVIALKLLDKKTKNEISLENLDEDNGISINYSSSKTTTGLFYDFAEEASETGSWYNVEENTVNLRLDTVQNGKVTLNVQMATWSEPVSYTLKVNVVKGNPKVKAKSSTLTLNLLSSGSSTSTPLTVTPDDVTITGIDAVCLSPKRSGEEEPDDGGITLDYESESGKLIASGGEEKGKYRFRVTPKVKYANGDEGNGTPFTVTVNVIEQKMSMKLKSSTVTLNRLYWNLDKREIAYTVRNMPAEDSLEAGMITMEGVNDASRAVADDIEFSLDEAGESKIYVRLKSSQVSSGTYKFKSAEGLQTAGGAEIAPFTVTVKVIEKAAKVSAKASGSINMLDKTSAIKYTLSTSNVKITPDENNVLVRELNTTGGRNIPYTDDSGEYFLKHFERSFEVEKDKTIIKIAALKEEEAGDDEDQDTLTAPTYKLQFGLVVDAEKGTVIWSKDVNVKPKQTLPKIKTDVTETTLYAGATKSRRSQELVLHKTTVGEAVISDVVWGKGNSSALKEAIKIEGFDPDYQSVVITLVRPDLLKPNTTYNLKLEALIDGQMANTAGASFTVKVKVVN